MIVFVQQVQQTHLRKSRKYPYMTRCTLNSNLLMQCSNPLALKAIAFSVRFSFNFEFLKTSKDIFWFLLQTEWMQFICGFFAKGNWSIYPFTEPDSTRSKDWCFWWFFLVVFWVFFLFSSLQFIFTQPYNGTMGVISGHHVAWLSIHVHVFW